MEEDQAATTDPSLEQPTKSSVRQRTFTQLTGETTLLYQIIDLGRQYYIWIAAGSAKQGNLFYGIQLPVGDA